jgi:hypothetical protein
MGIGMVNESVEVVCLPNPSDRRIYFCNSNSSNFLIYICLYVITAWRYQSTVWLFFNDFIVLLNNRPKEKG